MKTIQSLFAGCIAALALVAISPTATAQDQSRGDQGEARREARAGTQLPLREIERRILPQMQGSEYLGPAYDSTARAYRLKFIRDGRVTYVDVDARTGRIIGRSR
ncbi:MAG: PepSY domain-containing protein [Erythrobacter sp.]|nr:PepSY domain-containing protein [Erythrobacter sp.]MDZ4272518.1 PepSY domain-containing protein [Erythrobacter sp.]